MPDQLTDDRLETLFADLRADQLARVRPPGTAAVRRTVRRRRTTTSVAAGVAVVAVAGGIAAAGPHGDGAPGHTERRAAAEPTTRSGPPPPAASLRQWRDQAASAIGLDPNGKPTSFEGWRVADGGYHVSFDVVAGTYTMRMACAGTGALTVVVQTGVVTAPGFDVATAPEVLRTSVPCAPASPVQAMTFTIPADGVAVLNVAPDKLAIDRAGYAYSTALSLDDANRLEHAARAALSSDVGADRTATSGFGSAGLAIDDDTATAGSYHLRVACAGAGSATVLVRISPERGKPVTQATRRTLACAARPAIADIAFTKHGTGRLAIDVRPDQQATEQAGLALSYGGS